MILTKMVPVLWSTFFTDIVDFYRCMFFNLHDQTSAQCCCDCEALKQNFYAAKIRLARTLKKSEDGRIVIFGDELYR